MKTLLLLPILFIACSCVTVPTMPEPQSLVSPTPIPDNSGAYMCPYTSDGTVCAWVEKGKSAEMGANVGSAVGAYAGAKAMEQVPFVGGFLGQKLGNEIGRKMAIQGMGGMESIKEGTDQSFTNIDDMIVYLYVNHSTHEDYATVVKLTGKLYPEFQKRQVVALRSAKTVATIPSAQ